jgi:Tol biopolymer transport system component
VKRALAGAALALLAAAGCGGGEPDAEGGRIALFRTGDSKYELVTARADGSDAEELVGEPDGVVPHLFTRPAWSPDGARLAFAGVPAGDDPALFRADLYVVDAGGGAPRRLTRTRDAFDPVWSPDGRTIVFTRLRRTSSGRAGSLWAMAADGSRPRRLTRPGPTDADAAGSFAPGGSLLAFTRTTCANACFDRRYAIHTIRLDGSRERLLADRAREPVFSPDGSRIAYAGERDRNGELLYGERTVVAGELYVAAADGSGPRRLTRTRDLNEATPAWSPDGARIAFQRGREIGNGEAMSLYALNADGTCERAVLHDPELETWYASPSWRPGREAGPGRIDC